MRNYGLISQGYIININITIILLGLVIKKSYNLYLLTQQSNTLTLPRSSLTPLTLREERSSVRMFENRVLRRIFGPKRGEVTGEWRKLHNEELNDLYCSPHIVRVIKLRRTRWAVHVARMGRVVYTGFWWGNLRERDHLGRPGVDGRIILRWIFRKWNVGVWTGSSWLRIGTGGGHL